VAISADGPWVRRIFVANAAGTPNGDGQVERLLAHESAAERSLAEADGVRAGRFFNYTQ